MRRSKRPGRSSAASIRSGRFVAAMTTTAWSLRTPSISCSSWLSTRDPTWAPPDRAGASASISSKKTMEGAAARALWKSAATWRSDSPTHLERSSGPLTARKDVCASAASALAASVLEQPGGPYSKTPRGGRIPSRAKAGPWRSGHTTASTSACLSSGCPPMSAQETLETCRVSPRSAVGRMSGSAASRSSSPGLRAQPLFPASATPWPRVRQPAASALVPLHFVSSTRRC
mmetsp:Transcript_26314/g.84979  ORF Transcript_26314/g.84979 Transcript_26314/m.84979 type:complete len:231 (-) Transcript_26314:1216-1908(-)